jgi:hypothetical protein
MVHEADVYLAQVVTQRGRRVPVTSRYLLGLALLQGYNPTVKAFFHLGLKAIHHGCGREIRSM